jgi:pimeloyl-ACP methyl ester carboxylesterase
MRTGRAWRPQPVRVLERSGHYPFVEEPDRFAGVVAAFLSSAAR